MKNKAKNYMLKTTIMLGICFMVLFSIFFIKNHISKREDIILSSKAGVYQYFANKDENEVYLSDIDYLPARNQSFAGWDQIRYNETNVGKITLKIEGGAFAFEKGIWAHATSQITYDISQYNYKYFTSYIGLNTTSTAGNGVIFKIFTSADGVNWGEPSIYTKTPGQEATFITIDLEGAKYLRLYADAKGSNAADHSVFGDAKLTNSATPTLAFETKEEYDEIIREMYTNEEDVTGELEFNLLKRQLISNIGSFTLNSFYNASEDNKAAIDFLMTNPKALKYYILGGTPSANNYYKSLTEFSRLYKNYKEDFNNKEVTKYGTVLGDLYLRMAVSLSLTHSHRVGLWINNASNSYNQSDSVRRYAIYRYMHKNNLLKGVAGADLAEWFEDYTVEEMRYVMATSIDDESILWLNAYTQELIDKYGSRYLTPHPYIAYVNPNDDNPVFYAEENREYFNNLFSVINPNNKEERIGLWDLEYKIPGGVDVPEYTLKIQNGNRVYKLWIVMRNKFGTGVVCGGISKTGTAIKGVHGIPAAVVGQPGHAAYIVYSRNSNGEGYWGIDNDVSGWAYSGAGASGGAIPGNGRGLLGWSSASYAKGYTGSYIPLAQEVINHNDTYEQSQKLVYLADSYTDLLKKEEIYEKALEIQPLNLNAWDRLIQTYKSREDKTEEQYLDLAKKMAETLKCYPLPMYQMTNLIKPKLTSVEAEYQFTLLQTRILKEGSIMPNNSTEVLQPGLTRLMANYLLGNIDSSIATFSFDGNDAGKIVLSSRFDGNGIRWDYSIDGKETWKEVSFSAEEEHKLQLTEKELATMTAENDLYVHIVGVNYEEENLYKIEIQESAGLPATLYANDLENKLIGVNSIMEWKLNENDSWTSYRVAEPNLTGDKTVIVRMGATGIHLQSDSVTYTFTADDWTDTRKYIPISHLSIEAYSTQSKDNSRPYYATNIIDGNVNTLWHTDFSQNVLQQSIKPFVTIKLDEPKNISALEFTQRKYPGRPGDPDNIRNARVYVSTDGECWTLGGSIENCATYGSLYAVEFGKPVYGQYVKIEMDTTNMFASLALVNLYEDTTVTTIAHFAFNGENAGKLLIVDEFKGANWEYSLDGETTWKAGVGDEHQLTTEELGQIDSINKIKIRLVEGNKESTIDIQTQEPPVISAYANDLENRLIGITNTDKLEWKTQPNTEESIHSVDTQGWNSYSDNEPVVEGDTKLLIRKKSTGVFLASEPVEFVFTADNQLDTAKYVSIKNISSVNASNTTVPSRGEEAQFAVDGLPTTMWHSNRTTTTMGDPRWITIELDEPRYISKIEYVRKQNYAYGIPRNGKVSVSMDGENWTEVLIFENLYDATTPAELSESNNNKMLEMTKVEQAKYIKIECTKSCDNVHGDKNGVPMDYFFSAAMINLFEDTTKIEKVVPTAEIEYSTRELTNQNVTATLVNESTEITVINNNGSKVYTFEDNGEFIFEFTDKRGTKGTATAKVDWIKKTLPTATIVYNTTNPTNGNVTATVTFDRDNVKIVNDAGEVLETITTGNAYTYTFTENGTHEIKFVGPYGNAGKVTAEVNWIDRRVPVGTIQYSSTNLSNQNVTATITFDKDNVIVKDGNTHVFTENGEYIFEFEDNAGNTGTAKAKVDWIDKTLPKATIEYSTTELTNQDVTATVTFDKDNVRIVDKEGNVLQEVTTGNAYAYTFIENGTHEIRYVGPAGNIGVSVATVNWIDKVAPIGTIKYSTTDITNKDVTATIEFNEENVEITNNDGKNTYTFELNGEFEFQFEDKAGNKATATAEVEWIDKREIKATIDYDIKDITNKDVIATITFDKENVTVINNDGKNTYTFTENGSFEFQFVGPAGNEGTAVAEVTWIDKTPPVATIEYSTTESTTNPVTATVTFDEGGVTITNEKSEPIEDGTTHVFTKNGTHTFFYIGPLGNKGTAVAEVTWIREKTADEIYAENKVEYIKTITDYQAKVTEEELNNKKINSEEKAFVIEAYNKLRDEDKSLYTEFITKVIQGGKPVITQVSTEPLQYKEGDDIDLYSLITIIDNEDGNIVSNKKNVNITTDLDTEKAGTYNVNYEVIDKDGNKAVLTVQIVVLENTAPRFKVVLGASKEVLNPGDEFEVSVSITNIKNVENGLIAFRGKLEYDNKVLELGDITGENKWNFDENSFNKKSLKFVTEKRRLCNRRWSGF